MTPYEICRTHMLARECADEHWVSRAVRARVQFRSAHERRVFWSAFEKRRRDLPKDE